MTETAGRLRIPLTGAGGRIGSSFRRVTGDRYAFRLAERPGQPIADFYGALLDNSFKDRQRRIALDEPAGRE